jgi:hypothetical protein
MKTICMHCEKLIRVDTTQLPRRNYVSHGICDECMEIHHPEELDMEGGDDDPRKEPDPSSK